VAARKNKKIETNAWSGLREAGRRAAATLRSGLSSLGLQGVLSAALIVAGLCGIYLARRHVAQMSRFRVYPARFRAQAPSWCVDDLSTVAFRHESYSIFDPRLTRDVAEAYLASPWVKGVRRVEKRFPNELKVELELREPAAFVRLPEGCYAVDADGVYLPLDYQRWDHERRRLPLVFGVKAQPPEPGTRWPDRRACVAVDVLNALAAEPTILEQIHFVDVANLDGEIDPLRSEVLLFTRRRVRIAWGRAPDTTKFGEPPVAQKLARLRRWLAQPLALSGGGSYIDLRFPEEEALAHQ
jgi:hypothetical protein